MNLFTKWIEAVIYPGSYQLGAGALSLAILVGLSHWHRLWLPSRAHEWLTTRSDPVKLAIYAFACVAVYLVTSFALFWAAEKVRRSADSR